MKKHLTLIGLLLIFALSLTVFSGCADKKSIVKDDTTAAEDEAARRAREREQADREAAMRARDAALLTPQNIYFDYDQSSIRPDARETLKTNASIFTHKSAQSIVIGGYCDERGTDEYNMALGQRRAQEAKQYLVNLGIRASRIQTISYGEENPLDSRSTEEAWAKNRRAEFHLK
ncbi:MAG: peptidoglycan-associated lipoprotein Pal [Smithellaceae bacterium]